MSDPTATARVAAVDLGATSGRVMAVEAGPGGLTATEVHRFPNGARDDGGHLVWDYDALLAGVVEGLRRAAATGPVDSVGIDTWGVDYGLLDAEGNLLGAPVSYRDGRTEQGVRLLGGHLGTDELYAVTGIQHQRFNTVYQLAAEAAGLAPGGRAAGDGRLARAERLLLMPDLIAYALTGVAVTEVTNASTTGMLDASTRSWSPRVLDALGIGKDLFGDLVEPGAVIGPVTEAVAEATGLAPGTPVIAVGSHDTASAVAAVPGLRRGVAFISSGTWSLVGLELGTPILTPASRDANFTNELGVDGTVRYLRNVAGLWLLSECRREWAADGGQAELAELLAEAAGEPAGAALVRADDDAFLAPGGMPGRIAEAVSRAGGPAPGTRGQTVRCIVDSLALAYAAAVREAAELSGTPVHAVRIVGGGSHNHLLCQATADATGLTVHAGPAEGTALGNALVQARALGVLTGGLDALRDIVAASCPVTTYTPDPGSPLARKAMP
ncbi:rhamnulokinase family protein [Streptomyces sp. NPDC047000]|uniref:rhamnulokinase n=1 Tax=Streptomyces sp. NPDC047000 TaxID=3155474 RepID=UPI0033FE5615